MPLLGGLGLIAIAFVIGSIAIGHGIRDRNQNNVIVVTGSAKKRITSDYIIWTLSVTSTQASATAAAAELSGWNGKIRSFLTDQGVEPAELTVQPISTEAISKGGQVRAYRLTRRFEIRSARVRDVTGVADHSATLLSQGIPLSADSPQYVYTKLSSLRPQLLAEATKDAQNRAKVIVKATGASLRSEEHTSELQSRQYLVCRLLLEKKNKPTVLRRVLEESC